MSLIFSKKALSCLFMRVCKVFFEHFIFCFCGVNAMCFSFACTGVEFVVLFVVFSESSIHEWTTHQFTVVVTCCWKSLDHAFD